MGVLSSGSTIFPKFSASMAAKIHRYTSDPQMFWRWKNVLEPLYQHAKSDGLDFTRRRGDQKCSVFVCWFVCPTIVTSRWWRTKFERTISPWSRSSTETIDTVGFVVVHRIQLSPYAAKWRCHKTPKSKNVKLWVITSFPLLQCGRINRSRWNLECKRRRWVYSTTPNMALNLDI